MVEVPAEIRKSYGLRFVWGSVEYPYVRVQNAVFGGTLLTSKHACWLIPSRKDKPVQGSSIGSLHIEGLTILTQKHFGLLLR